MAHLARTYLAYCDITRKGDGGVAGEDDVIAAAYTVGIRITDGGRNGIFFDRLGRDWDATITKINENPISIRQAFFSPYKRALRMIGDQVASAPPPRMRRPPTVRKPRPRMPRLP